VQHLCSRCGPLSSPTVRREPRHVRAGQTVIACTDLFQQVLAGEISANAAAIEASRRQIEEAAGTNDEPRPQWRLGDAISRDSLRLIGWFLVVTGAAFPIINSTCSGLLTARSRPDLAEAAPARAGPLDRRAAAG
jgi:hypothetical protein